MNFSENVIAAVLGLCLHLMIKWAEARKGDQKPGLIEYIKTVPAQSGVAFFAAASVFWVAYTMEWLSPGMAFAAGYMGNSFADNIAKQFSVPGGK